MRLHAFIFFASEHVGRWVAARWDAIIAPAETRAARVVEVVSEAVDVATRIEKERERRIEWTIEQYRMLGLSDKQIREKVLPQIEQGTDPLWVIRDLAARGIITNVRYSESGDRSEGEARLPK